MAYFSQFFVGMFRKVILALKRIFREISLKHYQKYPTYAGLEMQKEIMYIMGL